MTHSVFSSARAFLHAQRGLLFSLMAACSSAEPPSSAAEAGPVAATALWACAPEPQRIDLGPEPIGPELPMIVEPARGLGLMTARVPGTQEVVGGVRLARHDVRVTIRDGVAHTEVEEVFHNESGRVLEGRLVFPLPSDATLARLALWVEGHLIEGEVVERMRADRIFRGIVDDTVRPRDPALLDMLSGGKVSLRIFPIPAKSSRKVLFSYDQVLNKQDGELRYVYPLSLGQDRATPVDALTVTVNGTLALDVERATSLEDFVHVVDEEPPLFSVHEVAHGPSTLLIRTEVDRDFAEPTFHGDVALVLDVSQGQSPETLAAQVHVADAILSDLEEDESFALLACDSACTSFPEGGVTPRTNSSHALAREFLLALTPRGPSDPAGALRAASTRLAPSRPGQILLFSDGAATAGELSVASQLAHAAPLVQAFDVRVVGVGRAVDDRSLAALAQGLTATYDRFATGASFAARVEALASMRRAPVVRQPQVELPPGFTATFPRVAPATRAGEELVLLARSDGPSLDAEEQLTPTEAPLPRLWARERIAELETLGDQANAEITKLAIEHHLLARTTSLIVLENDAMFAQYGIPRTQPAHLSATQGDDVAASGRAAPPRVRTGYTMVSGRLPPESVQRVVRLNLGRARACYQAGLLRTPALAGRVVTTFVIGRDGSVQSIKNVSSALDAETTKCITRSFYALAFPQPEGGVVEVTYPLVFGPSDDADDADKQKPLASELKLPKTSHYSNASLWPHNSSYKPKPWEPPPLVPPSAVHRKGDDLWLPKSDALGPHVASLMARVRRDPSRRSAHVDLARGLLVAGRLDAAHGSAGHLVELDPEYAAGYELLAETSAATGSPEDAARALAHASALDPRSRARQLAAARAAMALGDKTRACAHLRALGELSPKEHATRAESCRTRGTATLPELKSGGFQLDVSCAGPTCDQPPAVVTITPQGRVVSPWTSGGGEAGSARGAATEGTYRTLLVAGSRAGKVTVDALGSRLTVDLGAGDSKTAVISQLKFPKRYRRPRVAF